MPRPYRKLYAYTVIVSLPATGNPDKAGDAIHDALVGEGHDICNAVFGQRITKAQLDETLKQAGLS